MRTEVHLSTPFTYDDLARRLYVSRGYAKRLVLMVAYGGGDPWERHLVNTEMDAALREWKS